MDFVFWLPWAAGVIIFILWIKKPISEFRQLFKEKQIEQKEITEKGNLK